MSTTAPKKQVRLAKPVRGFITKTHRNNPTPMSFRRRDACLANGQKCKRHNPGPEQRRSRGY